MFETYLILSDWWYTMFGELSDDVGTKNLVRFDQHGLAFRNIVYSPQGSNPVENGNLALSRVENGNLAGPWVVHFAVVPSSPLAVSHFAFVSLSVGSMEQTPMPTFPPYNISSY